MLLSQEVTVTERDDGGPGGALSAGSRLHEEGRAGAHRVAIGVEPPSVLT